MLACRDQIAGGRAAALPLCVEWCARHRRGPQVGAAPRRCCCAAVAALEEGEMARRKRAWEWLESTGCASGRSEGRKVQVSRSKRSLARRAWKRGEDSEGPAAHAPDLEQLVQERREVIHSAAAISASQLASESETEISQPPSDRPTTPDRLSELGLVEAPLSRLLRRMNFFKSGLNCVGKLCAAGIVHLACCMCLSPVSALEVVIIWRT
ncbi:hypothetical protein NDU88_001270 [Pleurodeles waltl]|uniref:Uncharacterized protein n=1 Tax=Pleurodeles waltl TaxID=8319 RepID=A0AAV7LX54_PLEWA|nr:hypothetical protein NDU88_001270 [Pleurodeles waltl]